MAAYPLIGVSGSIDAEETRHFILRDYLTAVIAAGGVPVLLSPDMEGDMLEDCLARLDGLLMAGGNDVSPALFDEPPVEALGEVNPLRDGFEMRLVRLAAARCMPVLGICRGVRAMAAALGGSLWQDLPSQYRTADGNPPIAHRQTSPGRYASHTVSVLPGTLLARLTDGAETLRVNSFHHQAVKAPGSLRVCALAPDGVIEAVEGPYMLSRCQGESYSCHRTDCWLHSIYSEISKLVRDRLDSYTFDSICSCDEAEQAEK